MTWAGGVDFLRMIVDSLKLASDEGAADLVLLVPAIPWRHTMTSLARPWYRWLSGRYGSRGLAQLRLSLREQRTVLSPAWQLDRLRDVLGPEISVIRFGSDSDIDRLAAKNDISCLLPSIRPLSPDVRTPWIGYIYDFQHRYLEHLFPLAERAARDEAFRAMAASGHLVVVNSQAARRDCLRFLGGRQDQFVAFPVGAAPRPNWLEEDSAVVAKYGLPMHYFVVANQFWRHKNHRLVFEAIQLLGEEGDVVVVCTGDTRDTHDRSYFPALEQFIQENGLQDRIRILGFIPKRDQIAVMKHAIAVIQPSNFEGGPGGGAIYDALSLGVPALVSDIPVNRELEGEAGSIQFFNPSDARTLASLMLASARTRVTRAEPQTLVQQGNARQAAVGRVLWAAIRRTIAGTAPNQA